MKKEILIYPDVRLYQLSGFVRDFNDDALLDLIQDMQDTINENSLQAICALQIGTPLKVVVLKNEDGSFTNMCNPTFYMQKGRQNTVESDESVQGLELSTQRYDKVKIMYDDTKGKQQFLDASGELSVLLQRKINLLFGELLIDRLDKKSKKSYDKDNNIAEFDLCPTYSYRDKILNVVKYMFIAQFIIFILSFISDSIESLNQSINPMAPILNIVILIIYFIYAQIETRQYKNCTSCQTANSTGNLIGYGVMVGIITLLNFFIHL